MLGDGIKRIQDGEYLNINLQRKCLYARRNMNKGEILTIDDIIIKGPGGGILPKYRDIVVGKVITNSVKKDHPITWETI